MTIRFRKSMKFGLVRFNFGKSSLSTSVTLLFLLALLFVIPGAVRAEVPQTQQPPWYWLTQRTVQIGGNTSALTLDANRQYAYFGSGARLYIADIHAFPGKIGSIYTSSWLGGQPDDIVVKDAYAYLAIGDQGLTVLDVSIPNDMREVSRYKPGGFCRHLVIVDNRLYLSCSLSGIDIFDLSNPSQPEPITQIQTPSLFHADFHVVGQTLYTVTNSGLNLFNVSNPTQIPDPETIILDYGEYKKLEIHNQYAYLSDNTGYLTIINLSTHKVDGKVNLGSPGGAFFIQDGLLYSWYGSEIRRYSLENPTAPTYLSHHNYSSPTDDLFITDLVATDNLQFALSGGLYLLNPNLSPPEVIDQFLIEPKTILGAAYFGGKFYVTTFNSKEGQQKLLIYDRSNIGQPVKSWPFSWAKDYFKHPVIIPQNNRVYAILPYSYPNRTPGCGITVLDVSDPDPIQEIGETLYDPDNICKSISTLYRDNRLFLFQETLEQNVIKYSLKVFDTADVSKLTVLATVPLKAHLSSEVFTWTKSGKRFTRLYVSYSDETFETFDLTDLNNVTSKVSGSTGGWVEGFAVIPGANPADGPAALYVGSGREIQIYDPITLTLISKIKPRVWASSFQVQGSVLINLEGLGGVSFYSIGNPLQPVLTGYSDIADLREWSPGARRLINGAPNEVFTIDSSTGIQGVQLFRKTFFLPFVTR